MPPRPSPAGREADGAAAAPALSLLGPRDHEQHAVAPRRRCFAPKELGLEAREPAP